MFRESYDYYVAGVGEHPNSTGWGLLQFDVLAHFQAIRAHRLDRPPARF